MNLLFVLDHSKPSLSTKDVVIKGSVIASIVTIPSLTAFFVIWSISDNVYTSAIVGAIIHFIAMGFSFKISKKFLVKEKQ